MITLFSKFEVLYIRIFFFKSRTLPNTQWGRLVSGNFNAARVWVGIIQKLLKRLTKQKVKSIDSRSWARALRSEELGSIGNNKTDLLRGQLCGDGHIDNTSGFSAEGRIFGKCIQLPFALISELRELWENAAPGFEMAFKEPRAPYAAPLPGGHCGFLWGAQGTEMEVSEMRGRREEVQERVQGNQTACQTSGGGGEQGEGVWGPGEQLFTIYLFFSPEYLVQEPFLWSLMRDGHYEILPFVLKGTTNGLSLGGDLSLKDFLLWEWRPIALSPLPWLRSELFWVTDTAEITGHYGIVPSSPALLCSLAAP